MNYVIIIGIAIAFASLIYFRFFRLNGADLSSFEEDDIDRYDIEFIRKGIIERFDKIQQTDFATLNLNKYETMKGERNKAQLNASFKTCACGNLDSKMFLRDYEKDMLLRYFGITEETYTKVIPFDSPGRMSSQDKFEVLLYLYKKQYGVDALTHLIADNSLDCPIGEGADMHFRITGDDITRVYEEHAKQIATLQFLDYLDILAQRFYQITYGLGCVDEISDMRIDGFNCGTSGIPSTFFIYSDEALPGSLPGELPPYSFNAVWLMYKGKMIHLSCIGFGSQKELERVVKRSYRYDNPGTLDAATGKIVNFRQDGSRITVTRPPTSESWMLFVRKFDTASKMGIKDLYPFEGVDDLIEVLHYVISGCRNVAITGEQATGKSTFLVSLVQFMQASYGIRVVEMAFELFLRKVYPDRNVATMRETATVSAEECVEFQRKTDGTISIFGEIAQACVAALAIQLGQVGAAQVVFTNHAKTVPDLVEYFRDAMIEAAGFNNEIIVEKTVARTLNFDFHLNRTVGGMRYLERVSMILPLKEEPYPDTLEEAQRQYYYRQTDRQLFTWKDIIVFEDGKYVFKNNFTDEVREEISKFLGEEEKAGFDRLCALIDHKLAAKGGVVI